MSVPIHLLVVTYLLFNSCNALNFQITVPVNGTANNDLQYCTEKIHFDMSYCAEQCASACHMMSSVCKAFYSKQKLQQCVLVKYTDATFSLAAKDGWRKFRL